jgi:sugar (pentulose or hexulose) kinase
MSVAVLDVGKTNVKVVLFGDDGAMLTERSRPNAALPPDPRWPYPRLDVEMISSFLMASLAELNAIAPIATISISTHGAAGVMVDEHGASPPPMDYEFANFGALDAEYDAIRPPFAETLSPRAPRGLNLGRSVYFYERRYPELFARARAFLMYPQYWLWRLTGALAGEVTSLACHGDLWRPREARLSSLVEARGWTRLFPPVCNAWDAFPILPQVAAAAGVSPATRVLAGAHDSNLSLVPHIVSRKDAFSVVSTGTWVILMAVGGTGPLDPEWDMLANVDVTGRPTPCARFMGGREYAALAGERPAEIGPAGIAAIVAAGVFALPAFSDQGGPFFDRVGRIAGPPPQTPAERTALATLYVALMTKLMLDKLEAPGDWIVEGGFAKTPAFASVLAALAPERNVCLAASTAGSAEGAARLARWGAKQAEAPSRPAAAWAVPGLLDYAERWRAEVLGKKSQLALA